MLDESKKDEELTSTQIDSTEDEQTQNPAEDTALQTDNSESQEEYTPPTPEEYQRLKKKAEDFDRSIELKRLSKLEKKSGTTTTELPKEIIEKLNEMEQKIASIATAKQNSNLTEAYKEFVKENKWADSDEVFSKISEAYNGDNSPANSKEELIKKLERAAVNVDPIQYRKSIEDRVQSRIMADNQNISAGNIGGGSGNGKTMVSSKKLTAEQIELAKKCGNDPTKVY